MLWLKKYKPTTIDNICGNTELVHNIKQSIENNNNIVIYGEHGVGKNITITCILNELGALSEDIYTLNACHDRSIKTLRSVTNSFLKFTSIRRKYIVIEDLFNLTHGSQQEISCLMDIYEKVTFILCTDTCENIMDCIQSRCSFNEFTQIYSDEKKIYLKKILDKEQIEYDDDIFETIDNYLQNDMCKTLLILQNSIVDNKITSEQLILILKSPFYETIKNIIQYTRQNKKKESMHDIRLLINQSYNQSDIIKFMFNYCVNTNEFDDDIRLKYLDCIGDTSISIYNGLYSVIQLDKLIIRLCRIQ